MTTTENLCINPPADPMPPSAAADVRQLPEAERLRLFGEELDNLRSEILAQIGPGDVAHIRRVRRFSTVMEIVGRTAIHFSVDPATFLLGVTALWLHKQVEATEIGHTVLHGAYDRLPGAEEFRSKSFRWDTPIDEEAWRLGHNGRHHGATNVAGSDPDMCFGDVRLTEQTPWRPAQKHQLAKLLALVFPNFGFVMNSHFTGLNDVMLGHGCTLPDHSSEAVRAAWSKALRKYVPYYLKNYVFYPALAGPMFPKVLAGNVLADTMRDLYTATTIVCGHVGDDVKSWPAGTRARGRGAWYAMQAEASSDFEVPLPISILCGALDLQIEHHLFPMLPPPRLRAIAPRVRAICEKYGVAYRTGSWPHAIRKALRQIARLSLPDAGVATAAA